MKDECEKCETSFPTMRSKLERLNAILSEALAIENNITGLPTTDEIGESKETTVILDVIENGLAVALDKAVTIVNQLDRIQTRL